MQTTLFVTPAVTGPKGGRAMFSALVRDCLALLLGDRLLVEELPPAPPRGFRSAFDALRGYIDGVTPAREAAILARLQAEKIGRLFLDGSDLGRLASAIKRREPDIEILTLFHNVEARFFAGALRERPSLRALAVLVANYGAERLAVRFSDRRITLNRRDSDGIGRLYGRSATDLLPMGISDLQATSPEPFERPVSEDYLLFVGGGFYANRAGIRWFATEVAPHIALVTCVVGRGLGDLRAELECGGKVRLIGEVDNLAPWYLGAKAVIAPIFDGSGMKTKIAEALMHGKRIAGTSEAFTGYEEVAGQVGWICDTKDAFIAAVREIERVTLPRFDPALRLLYERHYSFEAAKSRLAAILGPR